jgi:hypothetical protein
MQEAYRKQCYCRPMALCYAPSDIRPIIGVSRCETGLSSSSIDVLAQDYIPSRPTDQFVTTSITVAAWLIKQYACRGHQDAVMKHGYFVVLHLDDA